MPSYMMYITGCSQNILATHVQGTVITRPLPDGGYRLDVELTSGKTLEVCQEHDKKKVE